MVFFLANRPSLVRRRPLMKKNDRSPYMGEFPLWIRPGMNKLGERRGCQHGHPAHSTAKGRIGVDGVRVALCRCCQKIFENLNAAFLVQKIGCKRCKYSLSKQLGERLTIAYKFHVLGCHITDQLILTPLPHLPQNSHRICINLRNNLGQKWGGHIHPINPVATPLRPSYLAPFPKYGAIWSNFRCLQGMSVMSTGWGWKSKFMIAKFGFKKLETSLHRTVQKIFWTQSNNSRLSYCDISVWPYDLEYVLGVALGSGIIFTKFDLRQLTRALAYSVFWCWHVMSNCDLDLWPDDLESSLYITCHVIKVCTKFEQNRAIPGWIINNFANFCTRYVTPWPCSLTSWSWTLQHFGCHAFKLCTKFERNRIIHG